MRKNPRWIGMVLMIAGALLLALAIFGLLRESPAPAAQAGARFATSPPAGPVETAAPLHVDVTLDLRDSTSSGPRYAPFVDLQLRDAADRPAQFGDAPGAPVSMQVTGAATGWAAELSAPTVPGAYHVHLIIRLTGRPDSALDLAQPVLQVVPAVAYRGGLVYSRNGNLWRSDSAGNHTHRLTFYSGDGRADNPAWAPDGSRIAFTRALPAALAAIPDTEIWGIPPAGGAAAVLAARAADEDLITPAFAPGGALYFTSDRTVDPATGATPTDDRLTAAEESWTIARLDPPGPSGSRRSVLPAALQPDVSRDGRWMVYIGAPPAPAEIERPITHSLWIAGSDGQAPRLLVSGDMFQNITAPRLSPDGTQVAFAAVNPTGVPDGLNLWQRLGLAARPVAANGVPWDIYQVPAAGGKVRRLTQLAADMPFPAWSRDGRSLAILTEKALLILDLARPAAPLRTVGPGSSHGQLSWYQP